VMRTGPRYCVVPAAALDDPRLADIDYKTLLVLGFYADKHGWCHPYQRDLCERMGVKSRQAVSKRIGRLVQFGYVERYAQASKKGAQIANRYRVRFDLEKPPEDNSCGGEKPGDEISMSGDSGGALYDDWLFGTKNQNEFDPATITVDTVVQGDANGDKTPATTPATDSCASPQSAGVAPPQLDSIAPPQLHTVAPAQLQSVAPIRNHPSNGPSNGPSNAARARAREGDGKELVLVGEDIVQWAFDQFVELATELKLPVPKALNAARKSAIRWRINEHGPEGWRLALEKIRNSPLCRGDTDLDWRIDLDGLIDPKKFQRLIEGSYDRKRRDQKSRHERSEGIAKGFEEFAAERE